MTDAPHHPSQLVRQFRQILLWPLQLMPLKEGAQIQEPWDLLTKPDAQHPWSELRDEFSCAPEAFPLRHYSEFVTFLPYVRRFLYGEGKGRNKSGTIDSPIKVFRRNDIAAVRMTYPDADRPPLTFGVAHVDLCFFYDIDVVILVVEISGSDLPLSIVQDVLHRFGRAYPTYWESDGTGGHCVDRAEWLAPDGSVVSVSDYEQRDRYLAFVG